MMFTLRRGRSGSTAVVTFTQDGSPGDLYVNGNQRFKGSEESNDKIFMIILH
jgi:hypothetical protein